MNTPKTLIQIHYHNQLCGVNKVIGLYAKAFEKLTPHSLKRNFVLCAPSQNPGINFLPARIVPEPLCDYLDFPSKASFTKTKSGIVTALDNLLKNPDIRFPLCIIGHNMSIGKNCALSSAFASFARQSEDSSDAMHFLSVIHDFAEEGRQDCLEKIEKVKQWADIETDLFPTGKNIHLITLNKSNAAILKNAGFPCSALFNPVEGKADKGPHIAEGKPTSGISANRKLSLKAKPIFQNNYPTLLYPTRFISRKNILEAILLCTTICKANLLIGGPGANSKDKALFKKTVALSAKHKLPILFDYGKTLADESMQNGFTNSGFNYADACITTSIAEGFGYGLFEPWLFNKAVFGRNYLGFKPLAGIKFDYLYTEVPIPIKWISLSSLRDKYWHAMQACFGTLRQNELLSNRKKFDIAFTDFFIKNKAIDFGSLDAGTQFSIIESLLQSQRKTEEWQDVCGKALLKIEKAFDGALYRSKQTILFNQRQIDQNLSLKAFTKNFKNSISQNPLKNIQLYKGGREEILREFSSFERFRLLLSKQQFVIYIGNAEF